MNAQTDRDMDIHRHNNGWREFFQFFTSQQTFQVCSFGLLIGFAHRPIQFKGFLKTVVPIIFKILYFQLVVNITAKSSKLIARGLPPGFNAIILFTAVVYYFLIKLEYLSLASLSSLV